MSSSLLQVSLYVRSDNKSHYFPQQHILVDQIDHASLYGHFNRTFGSFNGLRSFAAVTQLRDTS